MIRRVERGAMAQQPKVAAILGSTVLAVKSRLHRARLALRERLAASFEAGGARA